MHEPTLPFRPRHSDRLGRRLPGDSPPLELREDEPPGLVDRLAVPVALPVPDRADRLARIRVNDLEHPSLTRSGQSLENRLALGNLLRALRSAEVRRHLRIAHNPGEERQIVLAPQLDPHGALAAVPRLLLLSLAHPAPSPASWATSTVLDFIIPSRGAVFG